MKIDLLTSGPHSLARVSDILLEITLHLWLPHFSPFLSPLAHSPVKLLPQLSQKAEASVYPAGLV